MGMIRLKSQMYSNRRQKALQTGFQRVRQQQEAQFERMTIKFFREQEGRVAVALGVDRKADTSAWNVLRGIMGDSLGTYTAAELDTAVSRFALNLVDWDSEGEMMESLFRPLWSDTYAKGEDLAIAAYRLPAIKRPALIDFAKLRGSTRIKRIGDTTKDSIRRIVSTGIEEGENRTVMSRRIMDEMNTGAGRAKTIAQTETHASLMTGNSDMMEAGGIRNKRWITAGDGAVRSRHRKLNGIVVPINDKFPNGLRYPGDPDCDDPAEVINCRCDMVAGDY